MAKYVVKYQDSANYLAERTMDSKYEAEQFILQVVREYGSSTIKSVRKVTDLDYECRMIHNGDKTTISGVFIMDA